MDKERGLNVAVKKVPRVFNDVLDAKRILREIKLMRHFHHENVRAAPHASGRSLATPAA